MYTQAITTAAKVPKADIAGISDRLVNTNALPVVKDVTDMAFIARDLCECVCVRERESARMLTYALTRVGTQ